MVEPTVLLFGVGAAAAALRLPSVSFPRLGLFLGSILLFAVGYKGGLSLSATPLGLQDVLRLLFFTLTSALLPFAVFPLFKRIFSLADSAALAAAYGSVSAVTFLVATEFLSTHSLAVPGFMVTALVLMEIPALLTGLHLAGRFQALSQLSHLMTHPPLFSLGLGLLSGAIWGASWGLPQDWLPFPWLKIALGLFLLDLGLKVGRSWKERTARDLKRALPLGLALPLVLASAAWLLGKTIGLEAPALFLFLVLSASASYIAVPAVFRGAAPEADPGIYVGVPLGVTFPFNLAIGIPLYAWMAGLSI